MAILTYRGLVYPQQCDAMGHMNVQYYIAAFDHAFWHFAEALGYSTAWISEKREGWADVRYEVDFRSELRAGDTFVVNSRVVHVGRKSLTSAHQLSACTDNRVCADLLAKSVYFDLSIRRAMTVPDVIRLKANEAPR